MKRYAEILGNVAPAASGVRHAADIVAALAPPQRVGGAAMVPAAQHKSITKTALAVAPGAVGAIAGFKYWKKHKWLGAVSGYVVGDSVMPLVSGDRKKALCDLAVVGAGAVGAMHYRKLPLFFKRGPVLGWIGGVAAGLAATGLFVDGSPARHAYQEWKK